MPNYVEVNPNSIYLRWRRFYCSKFKYNKLNQTLLWAIPMTMYFLIMTIIGVING